MGLELDTLKNNDTPLIYNNTTGKVYPFYDWKHLLKVFEEELGYNEPSILIFFTREEIYNFFVAHPDLDETEINFEDLRE